MLNSDAGKKQVVDGELGNKMFNFLDNSFFISLKNTANRIKNEPALKAIVDETLELLEKKFEELEGDFNDKTIDQLTLNTSLTNIKSIIKNKQDYTDKNFENQGNSDRASSIFKRLLEAVEEISKRINERNLKPDNIVNGEFSQPLDSKLAKTNTIEYWQENKLRLEQNLLWGNTDLALKFEAVLKQIGKNAFRNCKVPDSIFICYAWPEHEDEQDKHLNWVQPFLSRLRDHLSAAGLSRTRLDIKDNKPGHNIVAYTAKAEEADFVLLIGTETLLRKHDNGVSIVCEELIKIKRKRINDKKAKQFRVFPLLISGNYEDSFPAYFELYTTIRDFKSKKLSYVQNIQWLLRELYSGNENSFKTCWTSFLNSLSSEEQILIEPGLSKELVIRKMQAELEEQEKRKQEITRLGEVLLGLPNGDRTAAQMLTATNGNRINQTLSTPLSKKDIEMNNTENIDPRIEIVATHYMQTDKPPLTPFFQLRYPEHIDKATKRANCRHIDLSNRSLVGADFSKTDFSNSILKRSNLSNVKFFQTLLDSANIAFAQNLSSCQLAEAIFESLEVENDIENGKKMAAAKTIQFLKKKKEQQQTPLEEVKLKENGIGQFIAIFKDLKEVSAQNKNIVEVISSMPYESFCLLQKIMNEASPIAEHIKKLKLFNSSMER